MSKVNIGDKIKVVTQRGDWFEIPVGTVLKVIGNGEDCVSYVNAENLTIELDAVMYNPKDFEKVEDMFFAGCNPPQTTLMGENVEPCIVPLPKPAKQVSSMWELNSDGGFNVQAFQDALSKQISQTTLGVYRPNLEDRKVGKVGMHMVDDGFPNALREVAKVMTWAAEAKGYKLHDWKNLPEASVALPSAGYRHRNDNSIQKALGLSAMERVDHESALLHKAHEAFNTLAELELILTGAIK